MATPAFGKTIVQNASGKQSATVFIMHGLGSSGEGLAHIGPTLSLPHVKFIYPTAPEREITINGGAKGTGWFDIRHPDLMNVRDAPAIGQSVDYVNQLVRNEVAAGTPADRIVIGGFSQGGHIALRTASQLREPLAGAIGLSTWCEAPLQPVPAAVQAMPVFVGHGESDPLVPVALARQTAEGLKKAGLRATELHTYPGVGHSTSPGELQDLRSFLLRVLPEALPTSEDVDAMSVKELRSFLAGRGVSTTGFLEKSEFVAAAKHALQR
jgi:predicted esterase